MCYGVRGNLVGLKWIERKECRRTAHMLIPFSMSGVEDPFELPIYRRRFVRVTEVHTAQDFVEVDVWRYVTGFDDKDG